MTLKLEYLLIKGRNFMFNFCIHLVSINVYKQESGCFYFILSGLDKMLRENTLPSPTVEINMRGYPT